MMILPKNWTATEWLDKMDKLVNYECPEVGEEFRDINNCNFIIEKVDIGNRMGLEVQGRVTGKKDGLPEDYSCTLEMWASIWRDKSPRPDPSKMKC